MRLTFRSRLIILNAASLGLLLTVTTVGLFYVLNRLALDRFDSALWVIGVAEGGAIAERIVEHGLERPDDKAVTNSRFGRLVGVEQWTLEKYVTVIDDERRVADVSSNLDSPLPADAALLEQSFAGQVVYQTAEAGGAGRLRVVYVPVHGPSVPRPFVVMVGLPLSLMGEHTDGFYLLALASVVVLVKVAVLGSTFLARRAVGPLEEITAAAESINASNLKERLPEPGTRDQIGRLAAVFNRMLSRLEGSFEAQRRFTDRAAHELRTPLTILKGETQVTLARRRTAEEYEAILRSNLEEIEKMVLMIDSLLLLARYEGGEVDLPCQRVQLDTVAANVADDLQPLASQRGVALRTDADAPLVVRGEPVALERLVYNLVENAIYYTPRGGAVTVRVSAGGGRTDLSVEDTGIGIAPEDVPHLYNKFFRSQAARRMRPEGSGIGLPVVAAIARLHGAAVEVTSGHGSGTKFVVGFPADARGAIDEAEEVAR